MDRDALRQSIRAFVSALELGPELADPDGTAERVADAWVDDLLAGYRDEPSDVLRPLSVEHPGDGLVVARDVRFVSICGHHLLPFTGTAQVAYLPGDKIVGLGRLTRLVDCLSRRLQIQERLTEQVADSLMECLGARGAACLVRAEHLCMTARGARPAGTEIATSCYRGELRSDPERRRELWTSLTPR